MPLGDEEKSCVSVISDNAGEVPFLALITLFLSLSIKRCENLLPTESVGLVPCFRADGAPAPIVSKFIRGRVGIGTLFGAAMMVVDCTTG